MKTGLILGKFMPLHAGHEAMVQFALKHCGSLVVLLCSHKCEPISGDIRFEWLKKTFANDTRIKLQYYEYDEAELPGTSVSSEHASRLWARYLTGAFPGIGIIFTSEPYGEHVARFMNIQHICFDQLREGFPVSSSAIRLNPFKYWNDIPAAVRPFYVKKVCISGSESTGKSTLTKKLAEHYGTVYVPEMARTIIETTAEVTMDDLRTIAAVHASAIDDALKKANKLLICDTDLNITRSYAEYLFQQPLHVSEQVEKANTFHLHLLLETDCPFVQDGTRLSEAERNILSHFHKQQLDKNNIAYVSVSGNWDERFCTAVNVINEMFMNDEACINQPSANIPNEKDSDLRP